MGKPKEKQQKQNLTTKIIIHKIKQKEKKKTKNYYILSLIETNLIK